MLLNKYAYTQDWTIIFEKGQKTINISSDGDYFQWFKDGSLYAESNNKYTATWDTGKYKFSLLPIKNGCAGDSSYLNLIVLDSITKYGPQVKFVSNAVDICPPSNAVPATNEVYVSIKYYNDTLNKGDTYVIRYSLDNGEIITSLPIDKDVYVLTLNVAALEAGVHKLRILTLMYGEGYRTRVDYSSSMLIPTLTINVKSIPPIGEINYENIK